METKKEKNYAKKPRNNVPFADKRETGDASNERKKIYIYIYILHADVGANNGEKGR